LKQKTKSEVLINAKDIEVGRQNVPAVFYIQPFQKDHVMERSFVSSAQDAVSGQPLHQQETAFFRIQYGKHQYVAIFLCFGYDKK